MTDSSEDPPFHFEIWKGPAASFGNEPKAIYYVENHNGQCGYGELATDYEIAAEALLEIYRREELGNWMAPTAFMIRQTLELRLKELLEAITERDNEVDKTPLGHHGLLHLWQPAAEWLVRNRFPINQDARMLRTQHLLAAFDAIDPSGDLFRFGISRKSAFGKNKSYDRVGLNCEVMGSDFKAAIGLLSHWGAAVFRLSWGEEEGWESDPYFDASDFPKAARVAK